MAGLTSSAASAPAEAAERAKEKAAAPSTVVIARTAAATVLTEKEPDAAAPFRKKLRLPPFQLRPPLHASPLEPVEKKPPRKARHDPRGSAAQR